MLTGHGSRHGLKRLETNALPLVDIKVDGVCIHARQGETILVALNAALGHVRNFEFRAEQRAGFCFMGACQDCWLWTSAGERVRACTNLVEDGMTLSTSAPEHRA